MKRIALFGIVVLFGLFLSSPVFCATSGNPNDIQTPHGPGFANMEASGMGFAKLGGDVEIVFDKDLKGGGDSSDVKVEDAHWYLGKISYNVLNRIDVFCLLGGSDMDIKFKQFGGDIKAESKMDFAWGVGGKVFIYEFPESKVRLTANGLYRASDSSIDKLTFDGADITDASTDKKFEITEWQLGANISKEFTLSEGTKEEPGIILVPYIGVRYSDSKINVKATYLGQEGSIGDAENDIKVGMPVGADLLVGNNFSLNVEGRFFDETALSAGLTIKL